MATTDVCPNCHARLDDEGDIAVDELHCPFCGADLASLESRRVAPGEIVRPPTSPAVADADGRFDVIEQSDSKLVVRIPPGGPTGFVGWFASLWLGLVGILTPFAAIQAIAGERDGLYFLLFLLPFLMIGLGIAYAWARMRFTETLLLLEPGRIVVQRIFFRRKRLKETALTPTARARLSTAYKQNNDPVYQIAIQGETESAKFGLAMAPEEKSRLVGLLNEFLESHDPSSRPEKAFPDLCPGCGGTLDRLFVDPDTRVASCATCGHAVEIARPGTESDVELPPESKVEIMESTDARIVIYVPPGGPNARFAGIFAAFWLVFMTVFTPPWFLWGPGGPPPGLIALLGLFWLIGFGALYLWIRLRFSRTFLLLEPQRLVMQRVLFGRKSTSETAFGGRSRACLVESYKQNDEPIFRVEVNGTNGSAKFGTALSRVEKDWFVHKINRFLNVQPIDLPTRELLPAICPQCEKSIDSCVLEPHTLRCLCRNCNAELPLADPNNLEGAPGPVAELNPAELSQDSEVTIHIAEPDRLQFSLPLIPDGQVRRWMTVLILPVTIVTGFLIWKAMSELDHIAAAFGLLGFVFEIVFKVIFAVVSFGFSLAPLFVVLYLRLGRISVDLDATRFRCRWHFGPLGPSRQVLAESITRVAVTSLSSERKLRNEERRHRLEFGGAKTQGCLVVAGEANIPLTTYHKADIARQVAGVVLHQLRRMGINPADA